MLFEEFERSITPTGEPAGLSPALKALWLDRAGRWEEAHEAVQDGAGKDCAWVHAYLHRKEGDLSNAGYWYSRARRQPASGSLDEEWRSIAESLCQR